MGCDASSWLCARAPVGYAGHRPGWFKQQPISFFCSKPPTVSCCSAIGPVDSSFSSSTSSVRSYGHRKTFDEASPATTRHWIEADQPLASHERFKVVSYNILGDKNATKHRDLYQNVPSLYLNWDRRKRVICEELIGWDPDIICLQEVDKYFDLSVIMGKAGYTGSYKRRTGDAADGCAMFWKADKFRLLEGESIEFKVFGLRDNVAQLSVFEMCKAESRRLLISNIHVLYYPSRGDVKLGQIRFLSSRAQILSEKWGKIPVLLTGDFNSTPQSAIYKFLSLSQLNIMLYDRRELSGQRSCHPAQVFGVKREMGNSFILMDRLLNNCWTTEEIKVATGNSECHLVVHPLKLNSAYATVKGSSRTRDSNGEPLATSYHSKFLGTVDYLWYSDGLVPTRVLDTLPMDILRRTGGLPCKKLGSDHLALVSEFTFTRGAKEGNNIAKSTTSDIVIPACREGINLLA